MYYLQYLLTGSWQQTDVLIVKMKKYILFLIIATTILLFGIKISSGQKKPTSKDNFPQSTIPTEEQCPYYVNAKDFPGDSIPYANAVNVVYPPKPIISTNPVEKIHEKFNPKNSYDETRDLYVLRGQKAWQEYLLDVDADGKKERILSGNVAMNHTPHIALVVKDGYVIFRANGAQTYITGTGRNNGFLLHETIDWNTGEEIVTRYLYQDGKFVPAWDQKICNVVVQNN